MFEEYIETIKDKIVTSTCELIRIPSINSDSNDPSMPFGKGCNDALKILMDIADI